MPKEIVTLTAAANIAGVTHPTVLGWCKNLGIGEQRNGVWHIDRRKLQRIIKARALLKGTA